MNNKHQQLIAKAQVALQENKFQDSIKAFDQALRLVPTDANVYHSKGLALIKLKRYPEALEAFTLAQHYNPKMIGAASNKGNTLMELKRFQEALEAFEQALHIDPTNGAVWLNKGHALIGLQRMSEASKAFELAEKLNPQTTKVYHPDGKVSTPSVSPAEQAAAKSEAYFALKRYQEALTAANEAIRLDPKAWSGYFHQGQAFLQLGRNEEAL